MTQLDWSRLSDEALLAALGSKEPAEAALAELIARHMHSLERYIRCHMYEPQWREDCLQDTLVTVMERASTWEGRASVKAWMFGIARYKIMHHVRRHQRHTLDTSLDEMALPETGLQAGWGAPPDAERACDAQRVREALERLPALASEVLTLRDMEGLTIQETAALLGISEAAVKSRQHRARLLLLGELRTPQGGAL